MKSILVSCAAAFALCLFAAQSAAAGNEDPEQLVRDTAVKVLAQISENQETFRQDPGQLAEVVRRDLLPLMDMDYSARLILGRAGRDATEAQIQAFANAMSDLLISRYSAGLLKFHSNEQLEVMPLRGEMNDKSTRVRTRVHLDTGKFAPVDYVFRKTGAGWKAFDVIIEGISYVATYRNQIIPEVEANGLDSVTERLSSGQLALKD